MNVFRLAVLCLITSQSLQRCGAAEYGTLETVPWRRPSVYTQPTPTRRIETTGRPETSSPRPPRLSLDVLAPGYSVLPRPRSTPSTANRKQQQQSYESPERSSSAIETVPPQPARTRQPPPVSSVQKAHSGTIPEPQWTQPPAPRLDTSWSPEGSIQMSTFQEPAKDTPLPAPPPPPKFETPPAQVAQPRAGQTGPDDRPAVAKPDVAPPPAERRTPAPIRNPFRRSTDSFLSRITRTPDMFGDFNAPSVTRLGFNSTLGNLIATIPGGGATRRFKNEHSRALPTDRLFVYYNHFHNAVAARSPFSTDEDDINQITFGAESTFDNGNWSVEIRMPFAGDTNVDNGFAAARSDGVGNLAVAIRKLLYMNRQWVIGTGLGITTPTGDEAEFDFAGQQVTIDSNAVHLVPWLAVQITPDENWFLHAFLQIDVPTRGDNVTVEFPNVSLDEGKIDQQVLMYFDLSAGYWWYRATDPHSDGLTGIATVVEVHYTTALEDSDISRVGFLDVGNLNNRIDVVNLTLGLHSEWNQNTTLRFAAVIPLRDNQSNRFFDSELQMSLIRRY